jgi:adenylate cyclase
LVDATTDTHLWAERYDREWKDIFALQDEIRTKIILALKVTLTPEEQERFRHAPTDNLEAYDLYLRGLAAYGRFTQEGNAQARELFERAIALDPEYAGAYTYLGWTHWIDWNWEWSPRPRAEAMNAQKQALGCDPKSIDGHLDMAILYGESGQEEKARAEAAEFLRLIANPNLSLEVWGQRLPYRDPAMVERELAALRKAGLK